MRTLAAMLLLVGAATFGAAAQERVPRQPMLQKTTVGSELYRFYCSNCHGLDAKGRPATAATRTAPPNLTTLMMNNGGVFPREAVRTIIASGGGKGSAHGTSEMPEWGTIFRAFEPNDVLVETRIESLIRYIESLQSPLVGTDAH